MSLASEQHHLALPQVVTHLWQCLSIQLFWALLPVPPAAALAVHVDKQVQK